MNSTLWNAPHPRIHILVSGNLHCRPDLLVFLRTVLQLLPFTRIPGIVILHSKILFIRRNSALMSHVNELAQFKDEVFRLG